jgi:GTPase SAR1 family protein
VVEPVREAPSEPDADRTTPVPVRSVRLRTAQSVESAGPEESAKPAAPTGAAPAPGGPRAPETEPAAEAEPAPEAAREDPQVTTVSDVAADVDPAFAATLRDEEARAREEAIVEARRVVRPPGLSAGRGAAPEDAPASPRELPEEPEEIDLLEAAERLRSEVAGLTLPLEVPQVGEARRAREELLAQLDDYLLPRLRRMDAPLLAVVGGSTGAGKSTLVNSLVRREVTRSGVLRPTTRSPVLVHHPYDSGAFLSQRILPGLARVTAEAAEPMQAIDVDAPRVTGLRLVPHEGMTPGMAIIDAPDIDSVVEANRDLAVQLLAAADLWIFVTTAARYADAVPWHLLRQAVERGVSVAVVLDRVPPEALQEIRSHLATMLRDRGLATSPMFTIPETTTEGGLLPVELVAPLHGWLTRLARDARARDVVVQKTLRGALDSLRQRVQQLAAAADAQAAADSFLRTELDATFALRRAELTNRVSDGTLLRGEVLARWQEFVGTGEFIRSLESTVSRLRDRIGAAIRGRPTPTAPLEESLQTGLAAMVRASAQGAVEETVLKWRSHPAGAALLEHRPEETRLSRGFEPKLERTVRDWQAGVLELVRTEGQSKRTTARALSFGVNGAGVVLMLVTFSQTAGLTGAEVGVAAGTAAVAQKILEALFGDQAVRTLAEKARKDLVSRVDALLEAERERLQTLLDGEGVRPTRGASLREGVAVVDEAR